MEWKTVKLGDILNFRRGHDLPHSEMKDGDIPVAGSNGCIGYHNIATPVEPIITIGRSGNVGMPYYYERAWAHNTTLYIDDFKGNNPKYLYYLIKTLPLASFGGGSAVPTLNRNHIHPLEVLHTPDKNAQDKIVSILSALDAKIENNNRINANLEAQAQALYKSWFVDFEPWGGKMPEDWKEGTLGEIVSVKRGGSPRPIQDYLSDKGYRWLKISDATAEASPFISHIVEHIKEEGLNKTVFIKQGSLVLSNSATPGLPKFVDLDTCIHDGWLYFPLSYFSNEYLYLLFQRERPYLLSQGNGSVFTNLKTDIVKNLFVIIPAERVLNSFQQIVGKVFTEILNNQRESAHLAALRDTLLPKLMKGEIEL